jgi:predicted ATPase/DNA-binding XRE family transcriptional regulator
MDRQQPFGAWMRRRRSELGLTQEQLAELVGCAVDTVRALENGRRRPSLPMAERLAQILQIAEAQQAPFLQAARAREPGDAAPPDQPRRHNLPLSLSSFVGRTHERAQVCTLLAEQRLVTLSGAGGSGKTRLALAAAADLQDAFRDGVWFVELAGLGDPALVPGAVARSLDLHLEPDADQLAALSRALLDRRLLIVLDNCEHLIDMCARLAEQLLRTCSDLHLCVTSRELLRLPGEFVYPVPTLPVPRAQATLPIDELARYDAISLFLERANAHRPDFALTSANASAVVAICTRLDGIPLAIELATARLRSMSPQQIVERLHQSLRLLTSGSRVGLPRQQTMRGALDWSYNLLDPAQRTLFQRMSVFAGGWDLAAAEVVGASFDPAAPTVLDGLNRLVEQSLVQLEGAAEHVEARYRLLEPVRQYAREQLEAAGDAAAIRSRHAAVYLALAEQARPELRRGRQVEWLDVLRRDHDNLRAVINWGLQSGEIDIAARIVWSLWPFWWISNLHREGRRFADAVLAQGAALTPQLRARVTMAAEAMAYGMADDALVERHAHTLIELAQAQGGDVHAEGYAYAGFGLVAMNRGELATAQAHLERARVLLIQADEAGMAAQAHTWIGTALLLGGEYAAAEERFTQGLMEGVAIGDRLAITNALFNLGQMALATHAYTQAGEHLRAGLPHSYAMNDHANIAFVLEGLAVVAFAGGAAQRAAQLFGAAEALIERSGLRGHTYYQPDLARYADTRAAVRRQIGAEAAMRYWMYGRAMSPAQILAFAQQG